MQPQKANIDTQNDGLQKMTPFKYGHLWVSMLDFWGVDFFPLLSTGFWQTRNLHPRFHSSSAEHEKSHLFGKEKSSTQKY